VRFDVRADNAIGFDYRARFRIHLIPRPADLCAHPPSQRAEKVGEVFSIPMRAFHALAFG